MAIPDGIYVGMNSMFTNDGLIVWRNAQGTYCLVDTSSMNTRQQASPLYESEGKGILENFLEKHRLATPEEVIEIQNNLYQQRTAIQSKLDLLREYNKANLSRQTSPDTE